MKWQTWSDKGIPLNPPMYSPSWTLRCTWRQSRGYSEEGWVQIFSSHRAHVDVGAADRELGWCPVSQTLHHHLLSHPAGLVFPFKSLSESSPPRVLLFFDREVLPRAGGSITDVRITPEGTSAADANAHMLHIYVAQRTIDWSTTMEDFSTNLIIWHWCSVLFCSSKAKTTLSHHRWLPPPFCQSLKLGSCSLIRYNRSISLFQFWTTNAKNTMLFCCYQQRKRTTFGRCGKI